MSTINGNENGNGCPALLPNIVQQRVTRNENEVIGKPHRMKNYCSKTENYDTLHRQVPQVENKIIKLYVRYFRGHFNLVVLLVSKRKSIFGVLFLNILK